MKDISIVIPTFNRATKILKPLNSILKQTYKSYKIIIIDDGSTDDTEDTVKGFSEKCDIVHFKLTTNSGPSKARNIGMQYVKTPYCAFLDSDDSWDPTFLEKMVNTLKREKKYGLVYCDSQIFDLKKNPYYVFTFEPYTYQDLIDSHGRIPTGSFMFRTECWHQVGGFREDMIRGEDFEWQLRIGELFDFIRYPEILHFYYRDTDGLIHNTSNSEFVRMSMAKLEKTKIQIRKRKWT